MKKYFIVFLSMLFVLSIAATSFGAVDLSGDARVRGLWKNNWDMNGDVDNDDRYWDQRIRVKFTGTAGDVEVRTRVVLSDGKWDGASNTGGNVTLDYGYLHIPLDVLTIDAGRQKASFGNAFFLKDGTVDRFKLTVKINDTMIGAFTDKITETNAVAGDDNLDDVDDYGLFIVHKASAVEGGALFVVREDNVNLNNDGVRGTGYIKVNVADVAIKGEVSMKSGDAHETTDKDLNVNDPYGAFADVTIAAGKANITVLAAFTQNGYVADDDFTPTKMIGTGNPTALKDFGQSPADGSQQNSFILKAGVDVEATADLSVNAQLAYLVLDSYGSAFADAADDAASALELDAGIKYQLAQNTTLNVDAGVMFPDNLTANDDHAVVVGQKIEIKF